MHTVETAHLAESSRQSPTPPVDSNQNRDVLLTAQQARDWIAASYGPAAAPATRTLNKFRSTGGGPAYVVVGERSIAYRRSALRGWVEARISEPRRSTSEAA